MAGSFSLDPLSELTDEERQKLLEGFDPGPIHTGALARGAQGFAPLPMPKSLAGSLESTPSARAGIDPDLFARFAAAQQRGSKLDALNALGHGFGADASLIAGTGVNTVAREPGRRSQPMAELSARLGAERSIQQMDRQKELDAVNLAKTRADTRKSEVTALASEADAKREAALADPTSPESNALRATASELLKDRISPKTLATMSGVQLREALKYGTSMVNAEAMAQYRNDQMAQADKNAILNRAMQAHALEQGWNIFALTQAQQAELAQKRMDLERDLAELKAGQEAAKHERDRGEKLAEREVGGFKFAPGRTPDADSAKKMRDSAIEIGKLQRSLGNLKSLYSKYGTELYGDRAGLMESEFITVTNAARNLNNMGVPNGKDYEMLAKELQDPTTLKDLFTSKGRSLAKMDLLDKRMTSLVDDTARVYGYTRDAVQAPPTRAPATKPKPTGKRPEPTPAPAPATPSKPQRKTTIEYEELGPESPTNEKNPPWITPLKQGQKAKDVIPRGTYAKVPMSAAGRNGPFKIVFHTQSGRLVNVDED